MGKDNLVSKYIRVSGVKCFTFAKCNATKYRQRLIKESSRMCLSAANAILTYKSNPLYLEFCLLCTERVDKFVNGSYSPPPPCTANSYEDELIRTLRLKYTCQLDDLLDFRLKNVCSVYNRSGTLVK